MSAPVAAPSVQRPTGGHSVPLVPVVAEGIITVLADSVGVDRTGDTVDVHFDLMMIRTRRPEKFESVLRETLGEVYGDAGRGALATVPEGFVGDSAAMVDELAKARVVAPAHDLGGPSPSFRKHDRVRRVRS